MESSTMQTNAFDYNVEHPGRWAISVASVPGSSPREIALAAPFRNRQIRVSTVAEIRALGHEVVRTGKPPHATLMLRDEPTEETWEELRSVFAEPEPNPRYIEGSDVAT